jgi:hypothetical protein
LELKQIVARLGLSEHELIGNLTEAEWEVVKEGDTVGGDDE